VDNLLSHKVGLCGILFTKVGYSGMRIKMNIYKVSWAGRKSYQLKMFVLCNKKVREGMRVKNKIYADR